MRNVFTWLDLHPQFYWELGVASTLALLGWIILSVWFAAREKPFRWATPGFALLLLFFLFAWRWPFLFCASEYNPDESQFIAGAMALARDPVFWRSLDGVTSGPLDYYAPLPLHWVGLPLDYFGARVTALLLTWATLLLLHRTFRAQVGSGVAQLAVLPGAVFFAAATHDDFVHYSSELTPLALLALAVCLLARYPLAAAFVAGCLPWAKLQAAPLVVLIVGWQLREVWRASPAGARNWRRLGALAGCAAAPTLVSVVLVTVTGQFGHFYRRFFLQNVAYVQGGMPFDKLLRDMHRFASESGHFYPWLIAALLFLVVLAIMHLRQRAEPPPQLWHELTQQARQNGFIVSWVAAVLLFLLGAGAIYVKRRQFLPPLFWFAAALTAGAVFCIVAPSRASLHYTLFLTVPLTLWSGILLCDLWQRGAARLALAGLAPLFALVPLQVRIGQPAPKMIGHLAEHWRQPYTPLGEVLRHWRQPGGSMALWGWMSYAYVESGMPQATQDTVSQWCILDVPQQEYFRATYLADMQRNRPALFVDAVGPGAPFFFMRSTQAHENFPALTDYVRENYRLVVDLQYARVYVRTDILAAKPLPASELRRLVAKGRIDYALPVEPDTMKPAGLPGNRVDGQPVLMIEPPAELTWKLTGTERSFRIDFGMHPKSYTEGVTDGAEFIAELRMPGQPPLQVFHRMLDPLHAPQDRGTLTTEIDLPPYPPGTVLVVRTTSGKNGNNGWDWVYFKELRFAHSPFYSMRQFPGFHRAPSKVDCAYPYLAQHENEWLLMLPPPASLTFVLDGDERQLNFAYGLQEGSYTGPGQTDGASYKVDLLRDGAPPRNIFVRDLKPLAAAEDRGRQYADLMLPTDIRAGDRVVISIDPGGSTSWDWTYLSALDLR